MSLAALMVMLGLLDQTAERLDFSSCSGVQTHPPANRLLSEIAVSTTPKPRYSSER